MKKVFITGATGNVGMAVIAALSKMPNTLQIVAGVRDVSADKVKLKSYAIDFVKFDFMDIRTYKPALVGCDMLFQLRPPQISDTKKYFKPLIEIAKEIGIKHIVFISVQGVEKSTIIPHHKIEQVIIDNKMPYTFLRPAYFMQNFLGSLHNDLVKQKKIFLPAGDAKFTLVDVRDVGQVAATVFINPTKHMNKAYDLTANTALSFAEMAEQLSKGLGTRITYQSPNLIHFFWVKRKEKIHFAFILVMIMLHYLPRFQKTPPITTTVKKLIDQAPIAFSQFIEDHKVLLST
jgi:uncharacterized protein YbjT (DUF2867 family)